ncbi:MAG: YheV family putative metal-binding protein, partial [Gammaproteobacteria bacterium]|nr:YheV family putative metal-binding protein [Gammaproteobacteria bacterium]
MNMPRRFIAGAVCPKCAEMDRIVMYTNEDGQFRECVSCGYKDRMGDAEPAPEEL